MKRIPDSELRIMHIIWSARGEISTKSIQKSLAEDYDTPWTLSTIQSLLNRLSEKNIIGSTKHGKERYYFALVEKDKYVQAETSDFLERMHANSVVSLFSALHEGHKITKEQLKELHDLLTKDV